jgi:hypothetical protein
MVTSRREYYLSSPNSQKAKIAQDLIQQWTEHGGRFLKRATKNGTTAWYEVSTGEAVRTVQVLLCRPRRDKDDPSTSSTTANAAKPVPVDKKDGGASPAAAATAAMNLSNGNDPGQDSEEGDPEAPTAGTDSKSVPSADAKVAADALISLRTNASVTSTACPAEEARRSITSIR